MKAIIFFALLLAGCKTMPEKVHIPVAIGCLGPVPTRPVDKFGSGAYPGDKEAAKAALLDGIAWKGYAIGLEVSQAGCIAKPKD